VAANAGSSALSREHGEDALARTVRHPIQNSLTSIDGSNRFRTLWQTNTRSQANFAVAGFRGVKSTRHGVGIGTIEFDLNSEGLVGIADHVLPLVLTAGSPGELKQLAMKLVVGCEGPLAFGHL
jgi:hypothetical protein